jgi:hypothetical protein
VEEAMLAHLADDHRRRICVVDEQPCPRRIEASA